MAKLFRLFTCCSGRRIRLPAKDLIEKSALLNDNGSQKSRSSLLHKPTQEQETAVDELFDILSTSDIRTMASQSTKARISDKVQICGGWSEWLAGGIYNKLVDFIQDEANRKVAGEALQKAWDAASKAVQDIEGWSQEHPWPAAILASIIVLGILALMWPWVLEIFGFGELGPTAGSWAAFWQSRYGGFVPYGSLFSYLQRLGMLRRMWGWA